MRLFYFPQAAEYNAALCIDWLTCMAPKNRMVCVCLVVFFLFFLCSNFPINPLTPMSDQERISPYKVNAISSRQVMKIEKNLHGDY